MASIRIRNLADLREGIQNLVGSKDRRRCSACHGTGWTDEELTIPEIARMARIDNPQLIKNLLAGKGVSLETGFTLMELVEDIAADREQFAPPPSKTARAHGNASFVRPEHEPLERMANQDDADDPNPTVIQGARSNGAAHGTTT
jgi:hypothetical protein